MTNSPPSPHDDAAWSTWARSGLARVMEWVRVPGNSGDAGERYQTAAGLMRAMRDDLCAMRTTYDVLPAGEHKEVARALLCEAVGRYARYANLIYGGTSEALKALYPPGGPTPCVIGTPSQGRLDVCQVGVAQLAALPPATVAAVATAIVLITWMRTDLALSRALVDRIKALAEAHAQGVPASVLEPLAQGPATITSQVGGAVAAGVGLLFVVGAGYAVYRASR